LPESFSLPRGMRDTFPEEMRRRTWLYDKIREVVLRYGFQLVEPSSVESLRTLEAKSGPSIREEIYWFKDKSARSLGLRFDLTVGLARMIASRSDLPEPIKYAAIGGNWRYDEPQYGRYRYFNQWDVEIFGSASPVADAEVICVGADILDSVGLKEFKIRISNRKLIEAYLNGLGLRPGKKFDQTLRVIDKTRKASRQELEKEFKAIKVGNATVDSIYAFISMNGSPQEVISKLTQFELKGDKVKTAIDELQILADTLEASSRLSSCVYDMSIVRGIGYYDGIVFEAYDKDESVGAIFGGGRYDGLCKIYGKRDMPATGVAGGIERLMISLDQANLFPEPKPVAKLFIATVQEELVMEAVRIANQLRANGIPTAIDLKGRSLGKQLEFVNSSGIPYLLVLGRRELDSRLVKIKTMATRTEIETRLEELVPCLQSLT
jgi:histidyl-tRNA synthetase